MDWIGQLAERLKPGDQAVFDADGTLWKGDVGEAYQEHLLISGVLAPSVQTEYDRLLVIDYGEAYAYATRALAGLRETWVRQSADGFFDEHWTDMIFPEISALIERLGRGGVECWIVSASNRWIVEAGARHLNVPPERVIAMTVEVVSGVLSDRLDGVAVTRDGKATAIRDRLPAPPALVAGNSANDLAMLRLATRVGLLINPPAGPDPCTGEDLLEEAKERGWWTQGLAISRGPDGQIIEDAGE